MAADSHFDTIVVGSGFGGAVTAYRLAEAGQRVCVLERGKPYPPGSFPRRPREMAGNFWDPSKGYHGLFDLWSFRTIEAVVSSGLGGGSLIYANVLIRKDERWFTQEKLDGKGYEEWPVTRADLDPHYDVVERMLGAQRFPLGAPGFQSAKTVALRDAAGQLNLQWDMPNLAVTFANEGRPPAIGEPIGEGSYPNLHGQPRQTCRLTGECDMGCNYGSKNTLDHNYLSAAKHLGAEIRTLCEVRRFEPRQSGGYTVSYVVHTPENEGRRTNTSKLPLTTITADRLVLAAGALGTPYLLLRNRSAFPALSPALGTRWSGNGDFLGFLLRSHSGPAESPRRRVLDASAGPTITSFVRVPDGVDPGGRGAGFYVEDAGWPTIVDWMAEMADVRNAAHRWARFLGRRLWGLVARTPQSELGAQFGDLIGTAELSSGSLPLLGMGRDVPDGVMKLRNGYLDVDWNVASSKAYFNRLRQTMIDIADALGARYTDNPLRTLKRLITVHPLGGCPMGHHEGDGVVDSFGQVFGYPGLYIADGSVMPGPVGPNPSLTIAALADRMAQRIVEGTASRAPARDADRLADGVAVQSATGPPVEARAAEDGAVSLEFTEEMKGYVTFGELDFERGFRKGKQDDNFCMFHLTIRTDDVDRFVADPTHEAVARGWVECEALGGRRPVEKGIFNLFVDSEDPSTTNMLYRLFFSDSVGNPLTLSGFKDVHDDPGFDAWSDTSTLYTRILRGHVPPGGDDGAEVAASGIINIYLQDFARQLTTFRTQGPSKMAELKALADFGRLFAGKLWDLYAPHARADSRTEEVSSG
ncbi:MAG TPA: GMC family oxidoreductase [Acidimicrobiales bacterium]|nr:GMC family oxidoreductase [Acidimicrobiales bacterium]